MARVIKRPAQNDQQNSAVDANTQALAVQTTVSRTPHERAAILARLVIREGKPFNTSAVQAGYGQGTAKRGLSILMAESSIVSDAVARETKAIQTNISALKPLAIQRLYREISDPESPQSMKAIELAGRFRELDWFVRTSESNLGVFVQMAESAPSDAITVADQYKD